MLDWIVPTGQSLTPPLARNVKMDRGFHHERTGFLLCPAGMNWSDQESVTSVGSKVWRANLQCFQIESEAAQWRAPRTWRSMATICLFRTTF